MTSDEPTPGRCNARCRDGGYCENHPTGDSGRCRMHGGASPSGPDHPSYKHGAYSKHFKRSLTDAECEAYDDLVEAFGDMSDAQEVIRALAAEAIMKYTRSADTRFLREARRLLGEFNIADATDHVDVRSRHAGIAYTIVREGEDADLPTTDEGAVDHAALGFTKAPVSIEVETPEESRD